MPKTIILCLALTMCAGSASAVWDLDVETGYVNSGYNDVRVPGNTGTKISLTGDLSTAGKMYSRIRITRDIGNNQYLSFLYAPLSLDASGISGAAINFNGETFASGSDLSGVYRFDSYRATWYKLFNSGKKLSCKLGATAKIRDAAIRLSDGGKSTEKKNTGFVPLLHFGARYSFTDALAFLIDGDALAGGPGRAEDVLMAFTCKTSGRSLLRLGYRFVEGGADTDEVYTFALLSYISAAFVVSF